MLDLLSATLMVAIVIDAEWDVNNSGGCQVDGQITAKG